MTSALYDAGDGVTAPFNLNLLERMNRELGANFQPFTRLAELGGWDVAELWTDADRLFAVFGLVAAEPAQGS